MNYGVKMSEAYFFDTYALIEILKGNKNYEKYKDCRIIISIFNLIEIHYSILKFSQKLADSILENYSPFVVKTSLDVIKEANLFRIRNKRKNLSAADCIGYITAENLNLKFLTGDKEFQNMENVEFVK